ncbi:unnamed protein product [Adineta steineri]|uniref:Uncharacterized protein n=1 Tax=Adineta steineri TaxID=433720 RepID=A0A814QWR3_9BILA|nr:unnamed protein product [Adineta steineri]CAF1123786.1 unnamed protein product [Adineta steineri]
MASCIPSIETNNNVLDVIDLRTYPNFTRLQWSNSPHPLSWTHSSSTLSSLQSLLKATTPPPLPLSLPSLLSLSSIQSVANNKQDGVINDNVICEHMYWYSPPLSMLNETKPFKDPLFDYLWTMQNEDEFYSQTINDQLTYELIDTAKLTNHYSMNTKNDALTHKLATLQVEYIRPNASSIVIIIEAQYLPKIYKKIQQLCTIIFTSNNNIYLWSSAQDELEKFQIFNVSKSNIKILDNNIQNEFSTEQNNVITTNN